MVGGLLAKSNKRNWAQKENSGQKETLIEKDYLVIYHLLKQYRPISIDIPPFELYNAKAWKEQPPQKFNLPLSPQGPTKNQQAAASRITSSYSKQLSDCSESPTNSSKNKPKLHSKTNSFPKLYPTPPTPNNSSSSASSAHKTYSQTMKGNNYPCGIPQGQSMSK